jgi:hypothetical protein
MSLSPQDYATIRHLCIMLILATLGLAGLTVLGCRCCWRLWSLRRLHGAQHGAAYSIGMVATMPIYAMLVCMIIESTLALQVKIGTVYAAYAGARCAAVYLPLQSQQTGNEKVKLAVAQALASFASSRENHLRGIGVAGGDGAPAGADDSLYAAYAAYCPGGPISRGCLHNKLEYAWRATDVSVTPSCDKADANYAVTVRYKMPFHTAIGYLLGGRRSEGGLCLLEIESTVTLPKEGVRSATQTLGINYDPNHD